LNVSKWKALSTLASGYELINLTTVSVFRIENCINSFLSKQYLSHSQHQLWSFPLQQEGKNNLLLIIAERESRYLIPCFSYLLLAYLQRKLSESQSTTDQSDVRFCNTYSHDNALLSLLQMAV
jgi:hypothetical protein